MNRQRVIKIALQVFYWIFLSAALIGMLVLGGDPTVNYIITWVLVSLPFKLAIFYAYFYFFIPKWLNTRLLAFILVTLALCVVYPLVKIEIDGWFGIGSIEAVRLTSPDADEVFDFWQEYSRRLLTVLFNVSTAFILRFAVDWFRNRRITAQMEKYKLQSELALLRNQINPHFLFNTLNNIDSMVYKVSEEASEAIMKLSSIMRYMLYESNTPYVLLSKEVDYLRSYFDLEQMRVKNKSQIHFEASLENPAISISPMIFISFVENAFKHATATDLGIKVRCEIKESAGVAHLRVTNSFDREVMHEKDKTGGIGLQNVKRRLELIYPKRFELDIKEEEKEYLLNLKLDLNEN